MRLGFARRRYKQRREGQTVDRDKKLSDRLFSPLETSSLIV